MRQPGLNCEIHCGGFRGGNEDGIDGLSGFIQANNVALLIDATHPYAAQISRHGRSPQPIGQIFPVGVLSAHHGMLAQLGAVQWFLTPDDLLPLLAYYSKPFITIGQSILQHVAVQPSGQHWLVRTATPLSSTKHYTVIQGIGPFDYDQEIELMKQHRVDALVTKNSGGNSVVAKLDAARALGLPVFVQRRPILTPVENHFSSVDAIIETLLPEFAYE